MSIYQCWNCISISYLISVAHVCFLYVSLHRFIPRISHPYTCTTTGFSLNEVIQEWSSTRRQHEENSSQPLRDAQKGKAKLAQRRPISYASDMAATSWTREIPRIPK